MNKIFDVGIIGGGVSGVVIALHLAELGVENILFEQKASVVNGPPFCHLHAGGNLYPEISDEQCKLLMKQSIDMARLFPQSIDERPTLISVPKTEKYSLEDIERRLQMLVCYYQELIDEDPMNEILGAPADYYKIYSAEDLKKLKNNPSFKRPNSPDEWMSNAIKLIDVDKLKMPVVLVQEYGWNLFRLGAQAQLALLKSDKTNLKLNTEIQNIKDVRKENLNYNWEICTEDKVYKVNYLVNSSGFKTGEFDESLDLNVERLIEFKAAYVSKWHPQEGLIPELIFHGERGTPHGMAQLTPYSGDFYQIHGMTNDITLFENGLVKSKGNDVQPEFNQNIQDKLKNGWLEEEIEFRTTNAIKYISEFVPSFETAEIGGPPLFGAQQIPGNDPELRVGEVSFPCKLYARSEIVKASSALSVAEQIIEKIQEVGLLKLNSNKLNSNTLLNSIKKEEIDTLAAELAEMRGYPEALSRLVMDKADPNL